MTRSIQKVWDKYTLLAVGTSVPTVLPVFIYGTAWKKERTAGLVYDAITAGFRAIDTAAQPRHYQEHLVGEGIQRVIAEGIVRREDLYIQTKFSPIAAQDPENMPYNAEASVTEQVHASVKSSLYNLRPSPDPRTTTDTYIDTVVIHSPLQTPEETQEAWQALECYVPRYIRNLGISNCSVPVLRALFNAATVKPATVQNRFYPATSYDSELRGFCLENQIIYQSFWTLTANPTLVRSRPVQQLAAQVGISAPAALYTLVMALGNTSVLNGTTNKARMNEDLAAPLAVSEFIQKRPELWARLSGDFQEIVGAYQSM
ncbi:hypothetical protein N7539_009538 [Penicillium diatomitis]|uniref:NADP-dependent oxidoreductase domain-containing protein n=1 Tax=Penicillium diatomitis TaxID=2819901 RepID=A0A9W9WKV6_9EURO|nr:uncharacterized protein N7539_009538 [Penicillium diatomitis]KAJ5466582.1 hypothetical protein N7539_009538 [Penicillium diatomitis]